MQEQEQGQGQGQGLGLGLGLGLAGVEEELHEEEEAEAEVQVEVEEAEEPEQEPDTPRPEPAAVAEAGGRAGGAAARATRLPMSRIKTIMKQDPDVGLASAEAVFLVTRATEMLLETIAKEAYTYTAKNKKKTITKKDLDTVIETVDCLCFLDGAMDF